MVEAGTLTIAGQMNTQNIDRGFSRIQSGFKETQRESKTMTGSLSKISTIASGLGRSLAIVGGAASTALTGLASQAPQLAPQFAKMQVEMHKMSRTAGDALKPAFNTLADEVLPKIGDFLDKYSGSIGNFASSAAEGASDLVSALQGDISSIKNLIPAGTGAAVGFRIGAKVGRPFLGAAFGAAAGMGMEDEASDEQKEKYGEFAGTVNAAQGVKENFQQLMNDEPESGNIYSTEEAAGRFGTGLEIAGGAVQTAWTGIVNTFQYALSQAEDRDMKENSTDSEGNSGMSSITS